MNNITIVTNYIKDPGLQIAESIREKALKAHPDLTVRIAEMSNISWESIEGAQCIMVLGGDGTMLKVAKDMTEYEIPVIGVNLGTLGFLAEIELADVQKAIDQLYEDRYHIEERMMLTGRAYNQENEIGQADALNDVVLSRKGELQAIGYRVIVNGQHLNDFFADGIIISTPTGSTGYNMSAGGSIVEPSAKLIVLTAICPHTLSNRSIILSAQDIIEVQILPSRDGRNVSVGTYFDGGNGLQISEDCKVKVWGSPRMARVLKLSDISFLEVLHSKMNP